MNTTILVLGCLLAVKHFLLDSPLQTPYMYLNKGTFLHPGGLLHAWVHAVGTMAALDICLALRLYDTHPALHVTFGLVALDFFIHYFVDLSKVKLTNKYKWSHYIETREAYVCLDTMTLIPEQTGGLVITSPWYFHALILDQALHFATYILIIAIWCS